MIHLITPALLLFVFMFFPLSLQAMSQEDEREARRLAALFSEAYEFVLENYVDEHSLNPELLIEGALDGMFEALGDPYSSYIAPDEVEKITDLTTGEFSGVGMYIAPRASGGIEVIAPIEGQPAHRAGVRTGDIIISINGESATDFDINEVISRLRGEPGSTVAISFQRHGDIILDTVIERANIEIDTVRHAFISGENQEIGYLRISQFTRLTPKHVTEALQALKPASSLIVDLRNNPGGLLDAAVNVADNFLSSGIIVSTRSRVDTENHIHRASQSNTIVAEGIPIVVLINRGSASASEIVAAALGENGRASLIGEQSYGKGSVQQVRHFDDRAIKVTTSHYLTPSGHSIDSVGITPHHIVTESELSEEDRVQLDELLSGDQLRDFVLKNSHPSPAQIEFFVSELQKSGIQLESKLIRQLVYDEAVRRMEHRPVYNLIFDIVLKEAVQRLKQQRDL